MIEVSGAQVDQARPVAHAFSPARLTLARQVAGRHETPARGGD